jgi:hypothetical protein
MNPNRPLTREMLEELQKGHPSALIELVMRMQEAFEEMRQKVERLRRRVAELRGRRAQGIEPKWSGVIFAISRLERIQDNRLLVVVRVIVTSKAARSGTFLGTGPYFLLVQARMTLEEPLQCKAIFPCFFR